MKPTRSFMLTCLLLSTLFFPNASAQDFPPTTILDLGDIRAINRIVISPDGTIFAIDGREPWGSPFIWLFDLATGELLHTLPGFAPVIAFSPDGQTIAGINPEDKTVRLWDVATGQHLHNLRGHDEANPLSFLVFSPDGDTLVSATVDATIRLWDVATGAIRHILQAPTYFWGLALSPDGKTLAASHNRLRTGFIQLWDLDTRQVSSTLNLDGNFYGLAFSPDGKTLAVVSQAVALKGGRSQGVTGILLFDLDTRKIRATLERGYWDSFRNIAFSPDSKILLSQGGSHIPVGSEGAENWKHIILLWDIAKGQTQSLIVAPEYQEFKGMALTPDGNTLVSTKYINKDYNTQVLLWDISTRVGITPLPVASPPIGEQLTLNLSITSGENVGGYQATIEFNPATLRYVESENGDYLPPGAFFVPPVVDRNRVTIGATTLAGSGSGDGTLATLTFEVLAVKESQLVLHESLITDPKGTYQINITTDGQVTLPSTPATIGSSAVADVNRDGKVSILDLILIARQLGQRVPANSPVDLNGDGVVSILDLILAARSLRSTTVSTAPSVGTERVDAATIETWIAQARLEDDGTPAFKQGIEILENLLASLIPEETALLANYPNPFNPETWIPYQLAEPADVTLSIHAADGTLVRTLALGHQLIGIYQDKSRAAYWDGKNGHGESVPSGVYFYTLNAGHFSQTKKMLILK